MASPTEGAVRLEASRAFRRREEAATAVALRADRWSGRDSIQLEDGRVVPIFRSDSVLAIRERLLGASPDEPVILLTSLPEQTLGADVLARVSDQRIKQLSGWEPVRAAFGARSIAPRLLKAKTFPDALQTFAAGADLAQAPNGVLTESHAWDQLLAAILGSTPRTPAALIERLVEPTVADRLAGDGERAALESVMGPLTDRLGQLVGPAGGPLLQCALRRSASLVIPSGLVASIAAAPDATTLAEARGQMRDWYGQVPDVETAAEIGQAAEFAHELSTDEGRANQLELAGVLLDQLGITSEAWRSDYLPQGFEQRIELIAAKLTTQSTDAAELRAALTSATAHVSASVNSRRIERARMAARIWLRLREPEVAPGSFWEAAQSYLADGGWVDLAREALDESDSNPEMAAALGALTDELDARREAESRAYASGLEAAIRTDSLGDAIGVEEALAARVVPLAQLHPVLLIVLDGLSEAAFHSIRKSMDERLWLEIGPGGDPRPPMVAVLPSVTEFSRASLLSGKLTQGKQAAERAGFETALSSLGEVTLFHKADLADLDQIEQEIGREDRRVVGIVINAIDDLLDKGELAHFEWTLDSTGPLRNLMAAALAAERVVVIAGDHGYVRERGSMLVTDGSGGNRYRKPGAGRTAPPSADELRFQGRRVVFNDGDVVLPVVEGVRYKHKSAGYHGGATPQETLSPLVVLAPNTMSVDGWAPCEMAEPDWWLLEPPATSPPVSPPAKAKDSKPADDTQMEIFQAPTSPNASAEPAPEPAWLASLMAHPLYTEAKGRLTRGPRDESVVELLGVLERDQGVSSETQLAQALGIPVSRVVPLVASVSPLLNVEGFQILTHDQTSREVRLNRDLLKKQFSL